MTIQIELNAEIEAQLVAEAQWHSQSGGRTWNHARGHCGHHEIRASGYCNDDIFAE
jgi:hypothetical protein